MRHVTSDLSGECEHVAGLEGRGQSDHLIENAASGPYVSLLIVRLTMDQLRAGGGCVGCEGV